MIKAVIFDYDGVVSRYFHRQPKILSLAKELQDKGLKIALLSNAMRPLARWRTRGGALKDFDLIIFSCDIGVSKPNPESYLSVVKKLGLKPQECLFIDNRMRNINGAEAAGLVTILDRGTKSAIENIRLLVGK